MILLPRCQKMCMLFTCSLLLWCAIDISSAWSLPREAAKALRQCLGTYTAADTMSDRNAYDYCNVRRGFFAGKDRGRPQGRQLAVVDVVRQLRDHFRYSGDTVHSRRMAKDLDRCLRSYSVVSQSYRQATDRCRVKPNRVTAKYWGLEAGHKTFVELPGTLLAVLRFASDRSRHCKRRHGRAEPFDCRKSFEHGHDIPLYRQPVSRATSLSRTCRYQFGPKAGMTQYFPLWAPIVPAPLGSACWDGFGSVGIAVRD